MKYTRTTPCIDCPFLSTNAGSYGIRRLLEFASGAFPCHKTARLEDDGFVAQSDSVHCAGALIFLEKRSAPNQMMRIAERLGMYDHTKLDLSLPVA